MDLELASEMWFWRRPAPFLVVSVPDELCGGIEASSGDVVMAHLTVDA